MYGIIYKSTGPDGRIYIGQTKRALKERKGKHAYRMKKGDKRSPFQAALFYEGFNSFLWEQVDQADSQVELDAKEKYWIAHYNADDPVFGYNTYDGTGSKLPPETRLKISIAKKGKPNGREGTHPSEEARRNMSIAQKGRVISEDHRRKISETLTGKERGPMPEKTRQKISEALTGRKLSPEHCRKISELQTGKKRGPMSEEHRQAISEGHKRKGTIPPHKRAMNKGGRR
jgi:group I intron endonuclease